jgi:hypothetical protein
MENKFRNHFIFLFTAMSLYSHATLADGTVTSEKRIVSEFRELTISGPFQIVFSDDPHSDFRIKIETDRTLQQYVTVTQMGLSVFVNVKAGMAEKDFSRLVIYVDNTDIHALTINANTSQPSDIIWTMICPGAHLKISGSIPISIHVNTVCHHASHSTNAFLDKMNYTKLIADIDNACTTKLSGDIEEADILNSGTGALKAYDLRTDVVRIKNNSKASAEVNSAKQFYINNTAAGHIYYTGGGAVNELKEAIKESVCKEEYTSANTVIARTDTIIRNDKTGFNTDSLFTMMLERDQSHRRNIKEGDTIRAAGDDTENFACLKWYLDKYGFPVFNEDQLTGMFPTLLMHIDNYDRFMSIQPYLVKALQEGTLTPNTYAYSYDRSLIAGHMRPMFFYWNDRIKPDASELEKVNKSRHEIGLPDYPLLLNGKNF